MPPSEFEELLGYRFRDPALLERALTHRSYVNEHAGAGFQHNESLEFLGDSVLGFLVSARVFRRWPDLTEGELSKIKAFLVSAANLLRLAERIKLGDHLRLSRGEEKTGGRKKRAILVDAYEAVIGAIYLDGDVDAASAFVERQLGEYLESLDLDQLKYEDFKSTLQEQLHNLSRLEPVYRVVAEIGPDHRKTFIVQVLVRDQVVAEAAGQTKKEAQQAAARLALEVLGKPPSMPAEEPPGMKAFDDDPPA
jgi:ribonuclease-3